MHRLLLFSTLTLASLSFAEPADAPRVERLVQKELLKPLAAKEAARSRFSRAVLPPQERRVRVLDAELKQDTAGGAFVTFAVDARHGWDEESRWREATVTGCVYPATGDIFVKMGAELRPAQVMLGKKAKAADAHVCQAAPVPMAAVK